MLKGTDTACRHAYREDETRSNFYSLNQHFRIKESLYIGVLLCVRMAQCVTGVFIP